MKKTYTLALLPFLVFSAIGVHTIVENELHAEVASSTSLNDDVKAFSEPIVALYPGVGQKDVALLKEPVAHYLAAMYATAPENDYVFNDAAGKDVAVKDYYDAARNDEKSRKVPLIWKDSGGNGPYTITLSTDPALASATTYTSASNALYLANLYANTTYYWQVSSADQSRKSIISSFTTSLNFRMISAGSVNNIRDVGGRMTSSGKRVKQGIIFRGAEANASTYTSGGSTHSANITAETLDVFKNVIKIGTELDFRTDTESNSMTASGLGENVTYVRKSIGAYVSCVSSSQASLYKAIFELLNNANDSHVYFHCWGGADRTGTIGFLVNGLLGVSYTNLIIDYELTTFSGNYRSREDGTYNGTKCFFTSMINTLKSQYLTDSTSTIEDCITRYMVEGLGFTAAEVATMKANLLED